MDPQPFDLLGDPVDPNHGGRGRRTHVVNDEKRRLVVMMCAMGKTTEKIAASLGITAPTLRRHYRRQLMERLDARERADALILDALIRETGAGNVSAMKELQARLDRADLKFSLVDAAAREDERVEKMGKKEAAKVAAKTAHENTPWEKLVQ